MKQSDLNALDTALRSLSGSVVQLIDGKPKEVFFKFSGPVRMDIAKAARSIKPLVESFSDARTALIKQHGGPWKAIGEGGDAQAKCEREIQALLDAEVEPPAKLTELTIPEPEVTAPDNPVPASLIEMLLDYIH